MSLDGFLFLSSFSHVYRISSVISAVLHRLSVVGNKRNTRQFDFGTRIFESRHFLSTRRVGLYPFFMIKKREAPYRSLNELGSE